MAVVILIFWVIFALLSVITAITLGLRQWLQRRKQKLHGSSENQLYVGLFHPYCNAGGGGERVLWCAVRTLQNKYDNIKIIIYTGDIESSPKAILDKARNVFNFEINDKVSFVFLKHRRWVEAKKYPHFTLLGQSLGSMILGLEALCKFPPDIFIDTMGYAFTYPLFKFLGGAKIGCYVHYPIVSTDMLRRVQFRQAVHNNKAYVARNPFLTWTKLTYYRVLSKLYRWVGCCSETIMVNSSWTENHILELWEVPFKTHRVYPPCEVSHLKQLERLDDTDEIVILSVGQFRPEKDHPLQLQALYELRTLLTRDEALWNKIRLVIAGSCRHEEDYERLRNMQDLSKHLSLENSIEFKVNVPYDELLKLYQRAKIGIHTMWNEHFGIGIVECMAAGLIMVAHRSGGPLLDIVETSEGSQNGFLATDAVEYAACILNIIHNPVEINTTIRNAAKSSVERFSEKEFEVQFLRAISPLFPKVP
ncbi:GDP-Man:Man(3)GlcNAc(2)-PP-Dol alpha-1,2-mannosyltransferase [Scaptodrosophila lebanonensis]|uniref:GDP-Man:Man(3)GlcNAc(2)-PP-Dol alpha-1,2-mannosyltransferase n=1 Tax=Drosophila lebanonensis TaxID=7225 RepID=A0A6J2TIY0_DROLE|nr:GDP-Man:Man(3)GlcNAc(2)-PP-Dol alpha-1,2-mannosyltransferase [Scaptodrosophila lebanonensis]